MVSGLAPKGFIRVVRSANAASAITNKDVSIVMRQWLIWWYSNVLIVNCLFQTARVPNLGIRTRTTCSHLHPPELVVAINQGKEYNRVVPLIVVTGSHSSRVPWCGCACHLRLPGNGGSSTGRRRSGQCPSTLSGVDGLLMVSSPYSA